MSNTLKVICNPYTKETSYLYQIGKKWEEVDSKNALTTFTKKEFSDLAKDVVKEIYKQKYENIVFEGSDDDFEELEYAARTVLKLDVDYEGKKALSCKRAEKYFNNASEVLGSIEDEFKNLRTVIEKRYKVKNNEIKAEIEKFEKTISDEIPLVVMGTYSSGKSAFINALIGYEILPSGIRTTTSRIHRIKKSSKRDTGKVSFKYNDDNVSIIFDKEGVNFNTASKNAFCKNLDIKIIENSKDITVESHIFQALSILKEQKENISELIEIECPSENGIFNKNNYNFSIIDTPGSDSAAEVAKDSHFEILKKALNNQTNGLPIYVTTADRMNNTSNKELLCAMKTVNLDKNNMIIIVTQADKLTDDDIKDLIDNNDKDKDVIRQAQSTRIFFVSSIAGLAGNKKSDLNFYNKGYEEVFAEIKNKFIDKTKTNYKQLYNYNIMPELQKTRIAKKCNNAVEFGDEKKVLFANSGLECVVEEVFSYGEKHALYNKCAKAKEYLENAIEIVKEEIENKKKQLGDPEEIQKQLDESKRIIIEKIKEKAGDCYTKIIDDYPKQLRLEIEETVDDKKNSIKSKWGKKLKKDFNKEKKEEDVKRFSFIRGFVEQDCSLKNEYHNAENIFESSSSDKKIIQVGKNVVNVVKKGGESSLKIFVDKVTAGIDNAKDTSDKTKQIRGDLKKQVEKRLVKSIKDIDKLLHTYSSSFFDNKDSDLKNELIAVVKGKNENDLSDTEKNTIVDVIQQFPKLEDINVEEGSLQDTQINRYLFGKHIDLGDFNYRKFVGETTNKFEALVEDQKRQIESSFIQSFEQWKEELINKIEQEITSLVPELESLSKKKEQLLNEKKEYELIEGNISDSKEKLVSLLSPQVKRVVTEKNIMEEK